MFWQPVIDRGHPLTQLDNNSFLILLRIRSRFSALDDRTVQMRQVQEMLWLHIALILQDITLYARYEHVEPTLNRHREIQAVALTVPHVEVL